MPLPPARRRALVPLQVAVLAATLAVGALTASAADGSPTPAVAAAPRPAAAAASATHPFSDPTYYPLRVEAQVNCVRSNPGCTNGHSFWGIDETPTGQSRTPSTARVYAMGAGILHIKDAHGDRCTPTTKSSFGTEVWIDHGGGVVSRYGHLSAIYGHDGDRVVAGQAVGRVGDTGKATNCGKYYYTDYNVKHHGYLGTGVEIKTLRACARTGAVSYPSAANPRRYTRFNLVPRGTVLAAPSGGGSCLPTTVPSTATRATGVTMTKSGSGQLTVRWAAPSSRYKVSSVLVELSVYHPTVKRYDYIQNERFTTLAGTRRSVEFSKLIKNRPYRARVSFHNGAGWSAYGAWVVNRPA